MLPLRCPGSLHAGLRSRIKRHTVGSAHRGMERGTQGKMAMRRRIRNRKEETVGENAGSNKKKEPKVLQPGHLEGDWKQPKCPSADDG